MADETDLSPIRKWIIKEMTTLLPSDASEIRSDTNAVKFKDWTDMTQETLESIWLQEDTQRAINNIASGKGESLNLLRFQKSASSAMTRAKNLIEQSRQRHDDSLKVMSGGKPFSVNSLVKAVGTTTTCNAFLGVVVRKALIAGGLARRVFPSFNLPKAGGNAWFWYPTPDRSPKPGDFYQAGKRGGTYEHVGIIIDMNGSEWTTADSGQGGPSVGYDAIKRKKRAAYNIMGWIDADEFFKGWNGGA